MGYHQEIINLLEERGRLDSKSIINILKENAEKNPTATIYRHLNDLVAQDEIHKIDYWSGGLRVSFENEDEEDKDDKKESIGNRLYKYSLKHEDRFEIEDYAIGNKLVNSGTGYLKIHDQRIADESILFNLASEPKIDSAKQVIFLINKKFVRLNIIKRTEENQIWPLKIYFGRIDQIETLKTHHFTDHRTIIIGINDMKISSFNPDGGCHFSIEFINAQKYIIKGQNLDYGTFIRKNIKFSEKEIILEHFLHLNSKKTISQIKEDRFYRIRKSSEKLENEDNSEGNTYICSKTQNEPHEELFLECLII